MIKSEQCHSLGVTSQLKRAKLYLIPSTPEFLKYQGTKYLFFSLSSGVKSSPKCKFSCSCSCWCWGEWQNFAQISQVLAAQSCQIGKKQILLDMVKTLEWKAWDFYCTEWLKYAEIQIMSYHQDGLQLAQAVALMPDGYGNSVQSSLHCDREM